MIRPQLILDLHGELIVDNFAGGGGASTGIERGLGRNVDIAINHNPLAVAMHRANHPQTHHAIEDVFAVDPIAITKGRPVGAAWFSPDCTHFSAARGGKPRSKRVRGLAWVVLKWAVMTNPRVMFLENVREFASWGPLLENGQRCPVNISRTFQAFELCLTTGIPADHPDLPEIIEALGEGFHIHRLIEGLGRDVEWRELVACDYGAGTIRKRLFMISRNDGRPIVWPKPTHGRPGSHEVAHGKRKPWVTAADSIDFTIPCPSIFLSPEEARRIGVKRPLARASLRRIAKGVKRYVMDAEQPFLVCLTHEGGDRIESVNEPFKTITGANRGEKGFVDAALAAPLVTEFANATHERNFSVEDPLRTTCAKVKGGHFAVVAPLVAKYYSAKQEGGDRVGSVEDPLPTQPTENRFGLAAVHVARQFGNAVGHEAERPMGTTMSGGGGGKSQVVATFLAQHNNHRGTEPSSGRGVDEPLSTLTGSCSQQNVVAVSLLKYYRTDQDPEITEPLHTGTTKARFGVSEAAVDIPPLTPEREAMARQVAAFLRAHGVEFEGEFATTRSGLVIWDIGMRMFTPRELFRAQGFPEDYIINPLVETKQRNGAVVMREMSKTAQIEMCGNSVCPPVAAAIVAANVPEMAVWSKEERRMRA